MEYEYDGLRSRVHDYVFFDLIEPIVPLWDRPKLVLGYFRPIPPDPRVLFEAAIADYLEDNGGSDG
jgi:hypothetical protein